MDFYPLVQRRESCRQYEDRPVEPEKIDQMLACARLAPSACNSQPWHFTVVAGEKARQIAPYMKEHGLNGFAEQVPCFLVIQETKAQLAPAVAGLVDSQKYAQMDVGIVTAFLTLAAAEMGLGTCILGSFSEEKIREALDIPPERKVRLILCVGYPAGGDAPRPKKRKELSEIAEIL